MKLTGVKLKMSMVYHPQTDGMSEWTNKTVDQAIRYHVSQNQSGWVRTLLRIWFHLMNTINLSMGFSGFQLMSGQLPRIVPLLVTTVPMSPSDPLHDTKVILLQLEDNINAAKDNLLLTKITQGVQKDNHQSAEMHYEIGDQVMLSTFHHRREYLQRGQNHVTMFMPWFDGPFTVTDDFPSCSVYTIAMPNAPETYPSFHMSLLKPFIPNDPNLFPSWSWVHPDTVVTEKGEEWFIKCIIDEWKWGRGYQYLVWWVGEGPEMEVWLLRTELEDCEVLDVWLKKRNNHDE